MGFKDELYNELIEKVHVIFHSAATIRFSSPLRVSIKTNLTGTLRTIEFAKNLKHLASYVYLSTAFCNSNNRGDILEKVYKSNYDPYEMIKMAEDDKVWENFTQDKLKEMLKDHPNTYTFTKNLAENLIVAEMSGLPAAIVRPSIGKFMAFFSNFFFYRLNHNMEIKKFYLEISIGLGLNYKIKENINPFGVRNSGNI